MFDCLSPSATLIVACRVPSDSVMLARRLRSALIWRFIASWMSRGGTISRISTLVILTPQRSVTSSSLARRMWLISSRLASTSSSGMSPMTARSVVAASAWDAPVKSVTAVTVVIGIEDLRVDEEVDADRRVVLRDAGLLRHLEEALAQVDLDRTAGRTGSAGRCPGRVAPCRRPKKKTTRRSYSRTMWTIEKSSHRPIAARDRDDDRPMNCSMVRLTLRCSPIAGCCRLDDQLESFDPDHAQRGSRSDLGASAASRPALALSIGDPRRGNQRLGGAGCADAGPSPACSTRAHSPHLR